MECGEYVVHHVNIGQTWVYFPIPSSTLQKMGMGPPSFHTKACPFLGPGDAPTHQKGPHITKFIPHSTIYQQHTTRNVQLLWRWLPTTCRKRAQNTTRVSNKPCQNIASFTRWRPTDIIQPYIYCPTNTSSHYFDERLAFVHFWSIHPFLYHLS